MTLVLGKNSLRLVLVALIFVMSSTTNVFSSEEMLKDQVWIQASGGEFLTFNVEIAETPSQHRQGLMNRPFLAEDSGMLFNFGQSERMRSFWMRDTLIPLDMLFLAKDGTIHHIHHMAKPQDETLISSKRPSTAVLEINGGYAQALGIEVGDKVLHPIFRNMLAQ